MPVPGTLKRQPIDHSEIADALEKQFGIPRDETMVYLSLVEHGDMTADETAAVLGSGVGMAASLLQSMKLRGLIIDSPRDSSKFAPLHPRMSLTNVFKTFEKALIQSLRDGRATVDRVVNLLTPIFEERE